MWKPWAFCKTAVVALAAMLFLVQSSEAQVGVFVGGGGNHGGTQWGVSLGTPFYGGYASPNYGGYYGSAYRYGSYPYYGTSYYSPYVYNGFNSVPYSYTYGSTPYYSGVTSYDYNNAYLMPSNAYQSFYYTPDSNGTTNQVANSATIQIIVPANASVWFDGSATQQTGPVRLFTTPALPEGKASSYEVKASWKDANSVDVTRTRTIQVAPNQHTAVNFMDATDTTGKGGK
jgi:uncharacterized protein (TIGR03000 family)